MFIIWRKVNGELSFTFKDIALHTEVIKNLTRLTDADENSEEKKSNGKQRFFHLELFNFRLSYAFFKNSNS